MFEFEWGSRVEREHLFSPTGRPEEAGGGGGQTEIGKIGSKMAVSAHSVISLKSNRRGTRKGDTAMAMKAKQSIYSEVYAIRISLTGSTFTYLTTG